MRTLRLAFVANIALGVIACSNAPSEAACGDGENAVGAACVPEIFGQATLTPAQVTDLSVDATGDIFERGALLVMATSQKRAAAVITSKGGVVVGAIPSARLTKARFASATTLPALRALVTAIEAEPDIEMAIPDLVVRDASASRPTDTDLEKLTMTTPFEEIDSGTTSQLGINAIRSWSMAGIQNAWSALYDANPRLSTVRVAVLDGFVAKDPVFTAVTFVGAQDHRVVGHFEDVKGSRRHGTAVASIIGAPNDKRGMNGVLSGLGCIPYELSPQAVLARVTTPDLDARDVIQVSALLKAMDAGVAAGARVVNLSGGLERSGPDRNRLIKASAALCNRAKDVLFVFAAGNETTSIEAVYDAAEFWPAATAMTVTNAMSIAATDYDDERVASSNGVGTVGSVTLAAPGIRVAAMLPEGGLTSFDKTSAATALVSGTAGLLLTIKPSLTGAELRKRLVSAADPIEDVSTGGLRLNADRAVTQLLGTLPPEALGVGTCRPPDPPPAPSGHQLSGAAWVRLDVKCECIGASGTAGGHDVTIFGKLANNPKTPPFDQRSCGFGYCADIFYFGPVTIVAKPPKGAAFLRWEGDCVTGAPLGAEKQTTLKFDLKHDTNCRAWFDK